MGGPALGAYGCHRRLLLHRERDVALGPIIPAGRDFNLARLLSKNRSVMASRRLDAPAWPIALGGASMVCLLHFLGRGFASVWTGSWMDSLFGRKAFIAAETISFVADRTSASEGAAAVAEPRQGAPIAMMPAGLLQAGIGVEVAPEAVAH